MPSVTESIIIDRPREDVYGFMTDPGNATLWQTNVIAMEAAYEGEPVVGDRVRATSKVAGKRFDIVTEFTRIDRPKAYAFRTIESPFDFAITWTVEETGEGTKVTYHGEAASLGGFFGKLGDPIVTRMHARDVRSNLQNLKDILESDA